MHTQILKNSIVWGVLLWFVGYVLGFIFFFIVSPELIGWVITPIGTAITLWVLARKIKVQSLLQFMLTGIIWSAIAIIFDYFFIVKLLRPADGYYKADVYVYYALAFLLPVVYGLVKSKKTTVVK